MTDCFQPINIGNMLKQLGGPETGHTIPSLIKELVDNGLDASAKDISVSLDDNIITYRDDGNGMTKDALIRAENVGLDLVEISDKLALLCYTAVSTQFSSVKEIGDMKKKISV